MEVISKKEIIKQAKKVENYQGNESDIVGAEKSGKYHGFIAGAEWAATQLKVDKEELVSFLEELLYNVFWKSRTLGSRDKYKIKTLIQKHKQ